MRLIQNSKSRSLENKDNDLKDAKRDHRAEKNDYSLRVFSLQGIALALHNILTNAVLKTSYNSSKLEVHNI